MNYPFIVAINLGVHSGALGIAFQLTPDQWDIKMLNGESLVLRGPGHGFYIICTGELVVRLADDFREISAIDQQTAEAVIPGGETDVLGTTQQQA